jgi:hypothetical protein
MGKVSHFTRIRTQMVERKYLLLALESLGYSCETDNVEIHGFGGQRQPVEMKISTASPGYDIGFRRSGEAYEIVADWWGIRDLSRAEFLQKVTQRYAYHATRAELEDQGFALVEEETEGDRIHLVLRRLV